MSFTKFNILINDTTGVTGTDIFKRTQRSNPVLKFSGGDDEYAPIMASELTFNMLVEDAVDGKFLHLFTGNETRYEVQLEDAVTGDVLWQGFLLPDAYTEPYENGCFFVEFTATDGIGRLKNKYLPADFYASKKTIPQIIGACLSLTGNTFNTIIAPAITNAAASIYVSDLEIETAIFKENDKKKNAYDILESILTTMGCRLLQWRQKWYVIGINRFYDLDVDCEFYTTTGIRYIADGVTNFSRELKSIVFEKTPSITAVPPFKQVNINWTKNVQPTVFKEDIVYQRNNTGYFTSNEFEFGLNIKYWQQVGTTFYHALYYKSIEPEEVISETSGPFYLNVGASVALSDVSDKYVQLEYPVYVLGSFEDKQNIDVEINATIIVEGDPATYIDAGDYARKLLYEITLNNNIILSNKASFDVNAEYDYEFRKGNNVSVYYEIQATLKVEGISILEDGYINIKLHPALEISGGPFAYRTSYSSVKLIYNAAEDTGVFTKSRNIDFTAVKDVDLNIGFDKSDLTLNKFTISPFVPFSGFTYTIPAEQRFIPLLNYTATTYTNAVTGSTYNASILVVSESNYALLLESRGNIYVKKSDNILYEITSFALYVDDDGNHSMWIADPALTFDSGDDLYVNIEEEEVTETDRKFMDVAWKRYGETEYLEYVDALARLYHSTRPYTKFSLEGVLFGLYTPLDLMQFRYLAPRNYNPVTISWNIAEGLTTIVAVENLKQNITDYE